MITTPRDAGTTTATYNITKFTHQVLKRNRHSPPSLVLHLYDNYFRFEHQVGNAVNSVLPLFCTLTLFDGFAAWQLQL